MKTTFKKLAAMLSVVAIAASMAVLPVSADEGTISLSADIAYDYANNDGDWGGYAVYRAKKIKTDTVYDEGAYYSISSIVVPKDITVDIYLVPSTASTWEDWGHAVKLEYTNGVITNGATFDPSVHYQSMNINNGSRWNDKLFSSKSEALAYTVENIKICGKLVVAEDDLEQATFSGEIAGGDLDNDGEEITIGDQTITAWEGSVSPSFSNPYTIEVTAELEDSNEAVTVKSGTLSGTGEVMFYVLVNKSADELKGITYTVAVD